MVEFEVVEFEVVEFEVECGGVLGGVWWREVVELTSLIISIRHNYCNDVTRASLNKDGQNLLTKHFLASPHVCDTIEGLILAYYE